jgi:hypothetical protein
MTSFALKDGGRTYKHFWGVASGAVATIGQGVPTKAGTAGNVVPMVDGDGTTSQRFTGIAASVSTDTVAAAGSVWTMEPLNGLIYFGSPKVAGSCNTQAKINALQYKRVVFDLTSSSWTVDTAAADAATNVVVCTGGRYQSDLLEFHVMSQGTYLNA